MEISYKLDNFEGPLDLLLHLIEKNKVSIYDIPIVLITEQYLEYVNQMDHEDLDVVSDFLVMAATLLDIKSRMLLPKVEKEEEEDEEDPRAELVRRLLEYKMYKYMAQELEEREQEAELLFFKEPTIPREVAKYEEPLDLDKLLDGLTPQMWAYKDEMVTRMETAKKPVQTPKPTTTASSGEKKTAPAPKKVIKSVYRHAIFPAKTLESQEDIDAYVEHMRKYLTTMMKDHDGIKLI